MSGWATQEVLLAAFVGGLISVWLSREAEVILNWRWIASVLAKIGVSSSSGVGLSAMVAAVAPGYTLTAPLANVPHWAMAGLIAALAFKAGPPIWAAAMRLLGQQTGGSDA
jgi:hypothetical protein